MKLNSLTTKRPLTSQITGTFFRQVFVTGLSLAYTVLIARWLGKAGYGSYGITLLIPQLLTKLLNLGLGTALVYYLARKDLTVGQAVSKTIKAWLVLTIIGVSVGLVGLLWRDFLFPGVAPKLLLLGIAIYPVLLLLELLPNILLGIRDLWRFNLVYLVFPPLALTSAWALLTVFSRTPRMALAAYVLGQMGGLLTAGVFVGQVARRQRREGIPERDIRWRQLLSYAWKSHLGNIVGFLNYRLDLLLVNMLAGLSSAGLYIVAVQIGEKLWLLSQAVSTALFPRLAELHTAKEQQGRLTSLVGGFTFWASVMAASILAMVAHPLVRVLFGSKYLLSASALILLLPGITASSLGRVLAHDLAARGRPEMNFWVGLLTVIVNVLANLWWIPRFGINGAAAATSLSYSMSMVIKLFLFQHLAGLPWWRPIWPGRAGLVLLQAIYQDVRSRTGK